MPLALYWLAFGAFAIGTEAFLVAGLMPDIAADLQVSVAACGALVTCFALVYALGAPVMATLCARFERRHVLLVALGAFVVTNIAAVLTPNFASLLGVRVAMALSSSLYMPSAMALAGSLVGPERRGRALAIVGTGVTVATALGVPFGTLVGTALGWRAAFAAVAILGAIGVLGLMAGLPRAAPPPALTLRQRLAPLSQPAVAQALLMTVAWSTGAFTLYTYIAAYLLSAADIANTALALTLALFGAGGFVGNLIGGWATDKVRPARVIVTGLSLMALCFAGFSIAPKLGSEIACFAVLALVAIWAVTGWSVHPAQQTRLMGFSPASAPLLLALNASSLYLGMALGAGLGAVTLAYGDVGDLGWVAALCELAALALVGASLRRRVAVPGIAE
jgi:predicted MFS family arabinose efflux permease